ncbi:MAG: ACT domain-containing protein [Lachnospirales bacterium]
MGEKSKYFVLKQRAVPEVLLKVVEAKRLLESERAITVQEATDRVGISRSSFYKYKDDIFPFYDNTKGKTITLVIQMDDEQGLLSDLLHVVAVYRANILTIHQSIPVNGVAMLTLSVEVQSHTGNVSSMIEEMEVMKGIHYVKILARE